MTELFLDILDEPRRTFFPRLSVFTPMGGVLGGGTAIALQIGHRYSLDFDIFFPDAITQNHTKEALLLGNGQGERRVDTTEQFTITYPSGINLTLLSYPFPPLYSTKKTSGAPLFDLKDLTTNKAYTIGRRGVWRDYVDLFFLLKDGSTELSTIISETKKRFGIAFSERLFLEQLVYTKDITDFGIDFIKTSYAPDDITKYFGNAIKHYTRQTQ